MKIVVLNGSPKGEISVTTQYVKYIQKHFPDHQWSILSVAHEINGLERNQAKWQAIVDQVQASDGVLWATPVYFYLVPSQLKRFIELIAERKAESAFRGKVAAALTTSVHCMDHTAMNYLTGISEDLNMRFAGGFTPEMEDLEIPQERTNLLNFAAYFFHTITTGIPTLRSCAPINQQQTQYQPALSADTPKTGNRRIVLLTDGNDPASNLGQMIAAFQASSTNPTEVIDLHTVDIKGGCLGCIRCAYDNNCAYKDGLKQFIQEKLIPAEAIIFAGTIQDRYLSSRWKQFFDRSFVFGHTPCLKGKQIGFIISGPLRQLPNLRQVFEVYVQEQLCHLAGFATDEDDAPEKISGGLHALADRLVWALQHNQKAPPSCISVGLRLLFKEFVQSNRGIFRADHLYYKEHGLYRGRGKKLAVWMRNLLLTVICSVPPLRRAFQKRIKGGMIADLKAIVDSPTER